MSKKKKSKLRLKRVKDWDEHGYDTCAASRCSENTTMLLGPGVLVVDYIVGLCDYHWELYCKED